MSADCDQYTYPYVEPHFKMPTFTVFKGSESGDIVQSTTTRDVGPDEVLIKVTHSGVCGTDEHQRHRDIVLGHEGTGIIEASFHL
jgi:threonine dehydrogenase-like Zn-dependent dehydrogenase